MNTERLIEKIIADNTPVRQTPAPTTSLVLWIMTATLSVGAGVALMGVRENIHLIWSEGRNVVQLVLTFFMAVVSAASAIYLSIPGGEKRHLSWLPFVSMALWVFVLAVSLFLDGEGQPHTGFSCVANIVLLGVLPGVALFAVIRRGFTLDSGRTGLIMLLGIAASGVTGIQFLCSDDHPLHAILWHFLPVVGLGILGVYIGRRFIKA